MPDHKLRPGELTDEEKGVLMDSAKASDGASLIVDLVHKVAAAAYEKAMRRAAEIVADTLPKPLTRDAIVERIRCAAAIEREAR